MSETLRAYDGQNLVVAFMMRSLADEWLRLVSRMPPGTQSSVAADRLALGCLMLASESTQFEWGRDEPSIQKCLAKSEESDWAQFDVVAWQLTIECLNNQGPSHRQLQHLRRLIAHHNSGTRVWFHNVAWLLRKSLMAEDCTEILLSNIACQLGGVGESIGLLSSLHSDKERLTELADAFVPNEFEDQYRDRIARIKERGWQTIEADMMIREGAVRKTVFETVQYCVVQRV